MLMVFTSGDGGGGGGEMGSYRSQEGTTTTNSRWRSPERESAKLGDGGLVDLRP